MSLCHNCGEGQKGPQIEYTANGIQRDFEIPFEYENENEVGVAFWIETEGEWQEVPQADTWFFKDATTIRFNEAPEFNQRILIYRCTDLDTNFAKFYPGTAIKAQELNHNFEALKFAAEEARCAIATAEQVATDGVWTKGDETISKAEQQTGLANELIDENHIFSAAGIAARHDSYVQDETPNSLIYEQNGKIWNDTDDLQNFFWDAEARTWVSFTQSGPPGPQGNFGPPGKLIVSDNPPTEYPAVGDNAARPLESGDMWWDSNETLLFVYYVDDTGPQWVSVSKAGPQGPAGPSGSANNYRGVWTDSIGTPPGAVTGDTWIWNGGDGVTLDSENWGSADGETINNGDFLVYGDNGFDIIGAAPSGVAGVVAGSGIAVDATDPYLPVVSTTFNIEKGGNGMPYDISLLTALP